MQTFLSIAVVVLVMAVIYLVLRSNRGTGEGANVVQQLNEVRKELQTRMDRIDDQLDKKLQHSHATIQENFKQTSKIISDVTEKLTTLDNTNKQVLDFSSQLQNLQNILKNPKQRGVLGEYWLETLLSNVLPKEGYKMQYLMGEDEKTGAKLIADAVIFIRDLVIPIDAKFSLENYNRMVEENDPARREELEKALKADVKIRIDETSKYIRPEKGTAGFAFMFIPAEGVYYNLLNADVGSGINSRNLVEYSFSKHVMIVSPTSFYAYLQTVLLGLRELQLEKSTTEIIKKVAELGKHFAAYADYHKKLGTNLSTVVNQFNYSSGELKKVGKDVAKISSGTLSEDIESVEPVNRPMIEG
jgi:DNA recombination protein RmuC